MKQASILIRDSREDLHGTIPSALQPRRAVEENVSIASVESDHPKTPKPAQIESVSKSNQK
jgi:hypothetical protein